MPPALAGAALCECEQGNSQELTTTSALTHEAPKPNQANQPAAHTQMVFIGGKTVRTGDRIAVWSRNGQCKVIDGPVRARFFGGSGLFWFFSGE